MMLEGCMHGKYRIVAHDLLMNNSETQERLQGTGVSLESDHHNVENGLMKPSEKATDM